MGQSTFQTDTRILKNEETERLASIEESLVVAQMKAATLLNHPLESSEQEEETLPELTLTSSKFPPPTLTQWNDMEKTQVTPVPCLENGKDPPHLDSRMEVDSLETKEPPSRVSSNQEMNQVNRITPVSISFQESDVDQDEDNETETTSTSIQKESPGFFLMEELQWIDEQSPDGHSAWDKPIRWLDDFALVFATKKRTRPLPCQVNPTEWAYLSQIHNKAILGLGWVSPVFVDSEEEIETPLVKPLPFETTDILTYDVEFDTEGIPTFWLETEYAWYKLGTPFPSYSDTFVQSVISSYVVGRLLSRVLKDEDYQLTCEAIQASLEGYEVTIGNVQFTLTPMHWDYVYEDLKEGLYHFAPEGTPLDHPVIRSILKKKIPLKCPTPSNLEVKPKRRLTSSLGRRHRPPPPPSTSHPKVTSRTPTSHLSKPTTPSNDPPAVLTPLVENICEELGVYRVHTECVGNPHLFAQAARCTAIPLTRSKVEGVDPKVPGDLVEWGLGSRVTSMGIIQRIKNKYAHLIKVVSGRSTLLGSFANDKAMYATYECLDIDVSRLRHTSPFPIHFLYHEDRFVHFQWNKKTCPGCMKKKVPGVNNVFQLEPKQNPFLNTNASFFDEFFKPIHMDPLDPVPHVVVNNKTYFCGDYVYFIPDVPGPALYLLGKITSIQPVVSKSIESKNACLTGPNFFDGFHFKKKFKLNNETASSPSSFTMHSKEAKKTEKEGERKASEVSYIYKDTRALGSAPPSTLLPKRLYHTEEHEDDEKSKEEHEESDPTINTPRVTQAMVGVKLLGRWNALFHENNESHFHRRLLQTSIDITISSDRLVGTLVVLPSHFINETMYFHFPHHFVLDHDHPFHDPREFLEIDQMYPTALLPSTDPSKKVVFQSMEVNKSPNLLMNLNEVAQLYWFAHQDPTMEQEEETMHFSKIKALDLFSGCGGLTVGFDSDIMPTCHTKYAIEMNTHAALTFKSNFKSAQVFEVNCNSFLSDAILEKNSNLPLPGDVEALYCGPPCQGFSGLNQFQKSDDSKNSLIAVALSFVEYYRPKFFLLENVVGMLHYRLGGVQASKHRVAGGEKLGVLRLIVRTLLDLGYQVTWTLLQAGNFGVPQNRRRVFIMATLPDLVLPQWPEPTHVFVYSPSIFAPTPTYTTSYCKVPYALLPFTTVECAISDLAPFEYANPNTTMKHPIEKLKALTSPIPQLEASPTKSKLPSSSLKQSVGDNETEYAKLPQSDFQRYLRLSVDDDGNPHYHDICYNHITKSYNEINVERICHIPITPIGSDHRALPEPLRPWALSHPDSAASRHSGWKGLYGRIRLDGVFRTTTTDMHPMGKSGTLIHPWQNRIVSVRETARSQGFPDSFIFKAYNNEIKEMYRQTGNAVPPLIAMALNREVLKALYTQHQIDLKKNKKKTCVTTSHA
ncbi:DNA (cytosine-5)-methyltransferase 1 [Coelomomyces lativittatus]|nr:DNA (cytosine-5)-methyltransferase 1 [Coelomomyces lativittatus]KAJ1510258.1 DNA (cytosine-5)-methyltransferase 1 [Coelomomyces lativittatus]KAJ1511907.1 DNA (cytosine-5)-methyltransferase 1 [Coelomomyces lativittatus]